MSTIESRGSDSSRLGPDPVCSSMIVSVRPPAGVAGVELLALLLGQALARVAADQEVRRARLVRRTVAVGLELDLLDVRPGQDRHRDDVDEPGQQDAGRRSGAGTVAGAGPRPPLAGGAGSTGGATGGGVGRVVLGAAAGPGTGLGRHHPGRVGRRLAARALRALDRPGRVGLTLALGGSALPAVQPAVLGPFPRHDGEPTGWYVRRAGFGASYPPVTGVTGDTGGHKNRPASEPR